MIRCDRGSFRGWLLAGLMLLPLVSRAQDRVQLSPAASISVLTILPGDAVYSAFGHSAFRVNDPETGFDVVYNYGTFDFEDPLFVPRFVYGALDYLLSLSRMGDAVRSAELQQRTVIEQHLDLSTADRDRLFDLLKVNARPENRAYRYDFLFDNCATRLRDGLERVLGQDLVWSESADSISFRRHLDPYLIHQPWLHTGIDLVLGSRTDRVATPREAHFLPVVLFDAFAGAQARGAALVARTDTLLRQPIRSQQPPAFPWPTVIAWAVFAVGMWVSVRSARAGTDWSRLDAWLLGMLGSVGLVLCLMWVGTLHHVTTANYNVLWALPTHLVFLGVRSRLSPRVVTGYLSLTFVLAALSLTGGWLLPQPVPSAAIPVILLLLVRTGTIVVRRSRGR